MGNGSTEKGSQLSILDALKKLTEAKGDLSSKEIGSAIEKLKKLKDGAERREIAEKRKREMEKAERKEREKREKEEAHIRKVTSMELPVSWENVFDTDPRTEGIHVDSISDALIKSLSNLGRVDIEYMSSITGAEYEEVINALRGSIYQNPLTWGECFYKGWETAEEYLSGNIISKWEAAREANDKYRGYFDDNIKALDAVMPPEVATKDIYVTLGSPWVPPDIIDDFIIHLFGDPFEYRFYYDCDQEKILNAWKTIYDDITGTWEIPGKTRYNHNVAMTNTYGTRRMEALHILEKTLNMKDVAVYDKVPSAINESGETTVVNRDETVLAIEKQRKMREDFEKWIWEDDERKNRLKIIFENKYSCIRKRNFDGSFLEFPTMSKNVKLYPYQKNAVARILFTNNTLLAHDVGSGKTYVMIAAAMEMRRMGLSSKNLIVVPNNIVGQWEKRFREMYPVAKLLIVTPKEFEPSKRCEVLEAIRDDDFDAVIMAFSCFEMIPISKEYHEKELKGLIDEVTEIVNKSRKRSKALGRYREKLIKKFGELMKVENVMSDAVFFDELGITRLFIDEAHYYKNVPIETKIDKVLGINKKGSKKCRDVLDKVRIVQKKGGGAIFATATPITNSITDAFIMQKYLQNGELGLLGLGNFDSWVGMFAEKVTDFEIDVDTSGYRLATRFSHFHNLPELTVLLSQISDFHVVDKSNGIPDHDGYNDCLVSKTPSFERYLKDITVRADAVRSGAVSRKDDNMLKITTDGRKAALDMRLVDPNVPFIYKTKVRRCAENVYDIWLTTNGTQLVFCDISTPKQSFNIYDEMKNILCVLGVPEDEIAFVHDADSDSARNKLFEDMRHGKIRVLIGSTFKLGIGVNVQDKLIAVHHLDVPWRPADMSQREGRILRQGNENDKVYIYRYVTEGSFDAYSWQLLETKQRFISELLSGSYALRDSDDIDDAALSYAEVKALAVGNPLIKERVETANELSRVVALQNKVRESKLRLEAELREIPAKEEHQKERIGKAERDCEYYEGFASRFPKEENNKDKTERANYRRMIRDFIHNAVKDNVLKPHEKEILGYCGFKVILPANMTKEKPYLWLERETRYYVELGDAAVGTLIRIDNFLDSFPKYIENLREEETRLAERKEQIEAELSHEENYTEEIESLKKKLSEIDEKLGVNNK